MLGWDSNLVAGNVLLGLVKIQLTVVRKASIKTLGLYKSKFLVEGLTLNSHSETLVLLLATETTHHLLRRSTSHVRNSDRLINFPRAFPELDTYV